MTRRLVWAWALIGIGCTAPVDEDEGALGTLSLSLRQSTESGESYRLRGATLAIAGPSERTLMPGDDEASMQVELPAGEYTLTLEPGYVLEREQDGGFVAVEAELASDNPQPFAIAAGAVSRVSLRFELPYAGPVELGVGSLQVALAVGEAPPPPSCAPRMVINELDYDQPGADTSDFAELYNAGDCPFETAGATLVLINGGVAGAPAYATVDLGGAGARIEPGQHVVVGSPEVAALMPAGSDAVLIAVSGFSIQNGSPDGLRLEQGGVVLDALSYGGALPGVTETASVPADAGEGSLGRCPDGHDTGDGSADFGFHATPTPGGPNACS